MPNNPGARLWVRTSNVHHAIDSAGKLIHGHPFNRKLQLLIPGGQHRAVQVLDCSAFYYALRTNLAALVEIACAQASNPYGALSAVCLDRSKPACLTPDHHLHMLMSKDQQQNVGITGARVGQTDTYHIKINLTGSSFAPGNQHYNRVQNCLKEGTGAVPLLCIRSNADSITEVPTADVNGVTDTECLAHLHQTSITPDVVAPTLSFIQELAVATGSAVQSPNDNAYANANLPSQGALHDLYEWIGAVSCGLSGSDWHSLQDHQVEKLDLHRHIWTGLVAPCQVCKALDYCQQLVAEGDCPWAILSVWGFTGQPVSWQGSPANAPERPGGENDYSIVILPQKEYMLMVASGQGDSFQTV